MKQNCMFKELQSGQHSSMVAVYYSGCGSLSSRWMPPIPLCIHMSFFYL